MASITINIPDDQVARVVDALCATGHWSADLGVTKNAYAKSEAQRLIKERVLRWESTQAQLAVTPPPPLDM